MLGLDPSRWKGGRWGGEEATGVSLKVPYSVKHDDPMSRVCVCVGGALSSGNPGLPILLC